MGARQIFKCQKIFLLESIFIVWNRTGIKPVSLSSSSRKFFEKLVGKLVGPFLDYSQVGPVNEGCLLNSVFICNRIKKGKGQRVKNVTLKGYR
jgi:hypothetical protein